MKKIITKIVLILLLVVALPLVYFVVKQASSLSDNEAIVQRAFDEQLETILNTINQNSQILLNNWVSQLSLPVERNGDVMNKITSSIFEKSQAIQKIHFYQLKSLDLIAKYEREGCDESPIMKLSLQKLNQLERYYTSENWAKIEPVRDDDFVNWYFIVPGNNQNVLALIRANSKTFIDQDMKPGIESISQGRFNISVLDSMSAGAVNLSDTLVNNSASNHTKLMWNIPGYYLSIGLKSATIKDLVTKRSQQDNYIFFSILLLIVMGLTFVIYSIRKEIKLAELKSEFVSNVSHEIRTPLALISMYTETLMLNRVKNDQKKADYLNVIHHEANRLAEMVNRILSFSKMEKGKRSYHNSLINVNALVQQVIEHYKPHFDSQQVKCELDLCMQECIISADKEAVTEAMVNLLENAIKYGNDTNKLVKVRTLKENLNVVIEVVDNGIGISAKHQKYIFDKFYRVTQGNLAHKAKGSGIGLNIVKQIMDQHKGRVEVESTEGEGSCFRLVFNQNY